MILTHVNSVLAFLAEENFEFTITPLDDVGSRALHFEEEENRLASTILRPLVEVRIRQKENKYFLATS